VWLIAPLLGLLAGLGMIAARSRRRKAKADGAQAADPPEAGKGEP
jgi:hypothetical protein